MRTLTFPETTGRVMELSDLDIAESVIDLIGKTPMVQLKKIASDSPCPIIAKIETTNPGGSVKDRAAITMIDAAENEGLLKPGGTIVEPTSGNTGVGLAIVAAQRGYKCIFVMTDKVSEEKVALLKAYGSEVVVCPGAVDPDDPRSYYSTAERLVKETPNAFQPNQYHNPNNPRAHYETTGPEIWEQTKGRITHFVAGAGTGGTISGVGKFLKEKNKDIQIVVADPENSVFSGGSGRPYLVEGVGEDFWPTTYDQNVVDLTIPISDADSFSMTKRVTEEEGLLIGGSCGTAVAGAVKLSKNLSKDDLVVVLLPDSGRGYLSKIFNPIWMAKMGFSYENQLSDETVIQVIESKNSTNVGLVYLNPEEPVSSALKIMEETGFSDLPVAIGEMPISAAEVIGSVSKEILIENSNDNELLPVKNFLQPPLELVGVGEELFPRIVTLFNEAETVLVLDGGRPITVLSKSDVEAFCENRKN